MRFASLPESFRRTIRELVTPGLRMVDELECVASVTLAILLAHLIGAHNIAWAAFTGFVLMRGHVIETVGRGVMRIVGTGLGAVLAVALMPAATASLIVATMATAVIGWIGLYRMLTAKRGYAWFLLSLTFEMILLGKIEHPAVDVADFARTRVLEVLAGTAACVTISIASTLTVRRLWPVDRPPPARRSGWHPVAARHSAQAAVTLALLPGLHALLGIHELAQAGVTIMAVMIVPVAGLSGGGLMPVGRRLLHRMIGCFAGGVLAAGILLLAKGSAPVLIAGTCVGIIIGRHIENGGGRLAYVGLQFTLAVLVALVPDDYADAAIAPAIDRLSSIFIGMALLVPILLVWHMVAPGGRSADPITTGSVSE